MSIMKRTEKLTILIDGRLLGHSGLGRYIQSLVAELVVFDLDISILYNSEQQIINLPKNLNFVKFKSKPFSLKEQFEFFNLNKKFDVYWAPHFNITFFKKIAKKELVTIHDLTPLRSDSGKAVNLYFMITLFCIFIRNFTIFVDTKHTKRKFWRISRKQIVVAPLALPNEIRREDNLQKERCDVKFALTVGNLKPHKNLTFLIEFWDQFYEELALPELYIVGSDILRTIQNISKSDVQGVKVKTDVDDDELIQLYKNCEFFVFPSLSEGFGLPILEAQYFGAPLLCSSASCLPEVAGNGALYFDPTDFISLKIAIETLGNPDIRKNIILAGYKNESKYKWCLAAKILFKEFIKESNVKHTR